MIPSNENATLFDWENFQKIKSRIVLVFSPQELKSSLSDIYKIYWQKNNSSVEELLKPFVQLLNEYITDALHDEIINDFIVEISWILEEEVRCSAYLEAQLFGYLNLICSRIAYLKNLNHYATDSMIWQDSRDIFLTDENWLSATFDELRIEKKLTLTRDVVFIAANVGCTQDNENTILNKNQVFSYFDLILT